MTTDRPDYAARNGWDTGYPRFADEDRPTYVGSTTFGKRPLIEDAAELVARAPDAAIVGAPFDDAVSHRPGARFGPRAIRDGTYQVGAQSLQLDIDVWQHLDVVDAGDADIVPAWLDRGHAVIFDKVLEVARSGAVPIVFGGDHSITWPSATAIAQAHAPGSVGIVHFDAHADTADASWGVLSGHGTPMRRLIESGAVAGRNFVQVGLRGYWSPREVLD
jgi:arginase family enzyme